MSAFVSFTQIFRDSLVLSAMGGQVVAKKTCPIMLLINFLIQVVVSSAADLSKSVILTSNPPHFHGLSEGGYVSANISVKVPQLDFDNAPDDTWKLYFQPLKGSDYPVAEVNESILVSKSDFRMDNESRFYTLDTVVNINGLNMGKTGLRLKMVTASWDDDQADFVDENEVVPESQFLDVWVRRGAAAHRLTRIFIGSVIILITIGNVMMGCEIDLNIVWETVKTPAAPMIGIFTQFVIMPLLAYGIAIFVFLPRGMTSMALGLFITGCSPGGGASNYWTLLLDGNVNLSVTMTFLSTMLSLVMMPFWISSLGHQFLQGFASSSVIHVPYGNIVRSLFALVVPLLVGVVIQKLKPNWAAGLRKIMRPFIIFVLVFVVVFGCLSNTYMFRMMSWPAIGGGLLLPWCGFMFGCFTSILLRRSPADVTAIAVETGIQNTGIAILLLKASFSQPDSDIGAVIPVIVACFTPIPLLCGAGIHHMMKSFKKRRQSTIDIENKTIELVVGTSLMDAKKEEDALAAC